MAKMTTTKNTPVSKKVGSVLPGSKSMSKGCR